MGFYSGLLVLVCAALPGRAEDKRRYDLELGAAKAAVADGALALENSRLEATLLPGGYFTVGTKRGASTSRLDDGCQVTFGHPYAMTSYPTIAVDGRWYRLDEYFGRVSIVEPQRAGDDLVIRAADQEVEVEFALGLQNSAVILRTTITNKDDREHDFGLGMLVDPALGKWGDGQLVLNGRFLQTASALRRTQMPSDLALWERNGAPRGMGMVLRYTDERPDRLVAGNWFDLAASEPAADPGDFIGLYDLALQMHWDQQAVAAGASRYAGVDLILGEPDWGSGAFMRWDMPSFFTLTNNLMFPRELSTLVEVGSARGGRFSDARLVLDFPAHLTSASNVYELPVSPSLSHATFDVRAGLVFQEHIAPVELRIERPNGQVLDRLQRQIFFPATPESDTGLVVTVDEVGLRDFPQVEMVFQTEVQSSGQLVTDLAEENILIWVNDAPVSDITIGKDTADGANSADIVFVFDVTGSMGEEIGAVRNNIIEFADSLARRGVDFRMGMVTFLDEIENVYPLIADIDEMHDRVSRQFPHGGGDIPENSLDALMEAARLPFRPTARRVIIWITDAPYHERDRVTRLERREVIDAFLGEGVVVNAIGPPRFKREWYDDFTGPTGGSFYDINGNFRDILLDISRLPDSGKFVAAFRSPVEGRHRVRLRVRYAGLGGEAEIEFDPQAAAKQASRLAFAPNPFNAQVSLTVDKFGYGEGRVLIYNVLGQRVRTIELGHRDLVSAVWDGRDDGGKAVASGVYLVRLRLYGTRSQHSETGKVLFIE